MKGKVSDLQIALDYWRAFAVLAVYKERNARDLDLALAREQESEISEGEADAISDAVWAVKQIPVKVAESLQLQRGS